MMISSGAGGTLFAYTQPSAVFTDTARLTRVSEYCMQGRSINYMPESSKIMFGMSGKLEAGIYV